MSYDLSVYLPRGLSSAEVDALASALGLVVTASSSEGTTTVARGARQSYCFTVDGPLRVEPADLPEEVVAAVLEASTLYTVLVEGSAEANKPHAVRFARRMARDYDGAAVDEQTGQMWVRAGRRRVGMPARDERVDVVELNWYVSSAALAPPRWTIWACAAS